MHNVNIGTTLNTIYDGYLDLLHLNDDCPI